MFNRKNRLFKHDKKHGYKEEDKVRLHVFRIECQKAVEIAKLSYLTNMGNTLGSPGTCCGSIAHKRILGNSRPVRQIQRTCDMSGLLKPTARIRGLSTNIYTRMKLYNGEHNITYSSKVFLENYQ